MYFRLETFFYTLFLVKISGGSNKSCSENELFNVKIANCSGLALNHLPQVSNDVYVLDLSENEISYLDSTSLKNHSDLKNVNLSRNKLTKIELPDLPNLKNLDLSFNEINTVEDVSIQNSTIEKLNLNGNIIKTLKNSILEQNQKLKELYLTDNRISVVSFLSSESIQELYLSNNHLHYVKRESLINLVNLKKLIITNNKRFYTLNRDGFLILEELKILDASHCYLSKLYVNGFPKLEILNLSYNNISKIGNDSFKFNVNLSSIDLSFNSLNIIEKDSFLKNEKLEFLNLKGNKIVDVSWAFNLRNVKNLNLSNNGVTDILNLNLSKVQILDFSNNKIDELMTDFDVVLPDITELNVKSNRIKEITKLKSSTLTVLNLGNCKIINVDENAFTEVNALRKLKLSDNKIKNVDFVKHLLHLEELNLDENAWECKCKDKDQIELFENENVTILGDVVCVPDGLTWMKFCEKEEKAEMEKIQKLNSFVGGGGGGGDVVKKSSAETGWIAGGLTIVLLVVVVSSWVFYKKRNRNKVLRKFRKKDRKPTVDLLEATPPKPQTYHYSYVHPPSEQVEPRRTYRESIEPKFVDLQEAEEIQNPSSHIYSRIDNDEN